MGNRDVSRWSNWRTSPPCVCFQNLLRLDKTPTHHKIITVNVKKKTKKPQNFRREKWAERLNVFQITHSTQEQSVEPRVWCEHPPDPANDGRNAIKELLENGGGNTSSITWGLYQQLLFMVLPVWPMTNCGWFTIWTLGNKWQKVSF